MKSFKDFEKSSLGISRDILVIVYGSQYLKFMSLPRVKFMVSQVWVHHYLTSKLSFPSYTVGGNVNCTAAVENSMASSQKTKYKATIWPSNSTLGYISEKNENTNSRRYMQHNVHSSIIYNCQDMEAT